MPPLQLADIEKEPRFRRTKHPATKRSPASELRKSLAGRANTEN